jgi:formylglycine-generating enzyme required for sulfatase activity
MLSWVSGAVALGAGGGEVVEVTSPNLGLLKAIPAGTFRMGSPADEAHRSTDEVQHEVRVTRGFLLMEHEVTQEQWVRVMGGNPSQYSGCGPTCPVEQVSWDDAVAFAAKVSASEGLAYRLPTEAEWEYAARAGQGFVYSGSADLGSVAWTADNSGGTTHPVCAKARNAWGLCDLTGNVWEWVADWQGAMPSGKVTDPRGPETGSERVFRGGAWFNASGAVRIANRTCGEPGYRSGYLGFRLVRTLE